LRYSDPLHFRGISHGDIVSFNLSLSHGARQARFAVLETGRLRIEPPPPTAATQVSAASVSKTSGSDLPGPVTAAAAAAGAVGSPWVWMGTEDIVGEMALLFRDEFDQVGMFVLLVVLPRIST
jgi:hypothetical protein